MRRNPLMIMNTIIMTTLLTVGSSLAGEYHVAKHGNDTHEGSPSKPFLTIQRAAEVAMPGDVVTVHEGIYREWVSPPRGGTSDAQRIVYQAAPNEKVTIKGSEIVTGWEKVNTDVWKVVLPNSFFGDFNPFTDLIYGDWFKDKGRDHHTGSVYLNGHWLSEAATKEELLGSESAQHIRTSNLLNLSWVQMIGTEKIQVASTTMIENKGIEKMSSDEGVDGIGLIDDGDWATYSVDFGEVTEYMEFRVAAKEAGSTIEVRLDSPKGAVLATCIVPETGGWKTWKTVKTTTVPTSGKKRICLVFKSKKVKPNKDPLWFAETDEKNTTIWAQFKGVDPNDELIEVNARPTVFYPKAPGMNYITVRGFILEHAATPWAPPTAKQIGLIGTHWSKGWIIENNVIRYSICVGITLGKYGDEFDNKAGTADGYNGTIDRALANGWSKELVGSHLVRNNHISHCEQAGIVGSLGAVFSTITGNQIYDIHQRQSFGGVEMAGIKFHAPIDTTISHNHIYRCGGFGGIWLDWMTQGARISSNFMHDNSRDLFMEVNHGPFLVDHNIFLSKAGLLESSGGGAYAHNLFGGSIKLREERRRETPFHHAHSTAIHSLNRVVNDDERFYNNLFVGHSGLSVYDNWETPNLKLGGNVYLSGARPAAREHEALVLPDVKASLRTEKRADGWWLNIEIDPAWSMNRKRDLVTTQTLGKTKTFDTIFEQPDGSPYRLDIDFFGNKRDKNNPAPGPFALQKDGAQNLHVWKTIPMK